MKSKPAPPAKRRTGYAHTIQWYADTYRIPVVTVWKARKRGWPLDDPPTLLKKFEDAPGPKTTLDALRAIVNGDTKTLQRRQREAAESESKDEDLPGEDADEVQTSMAIAGGLMQELARLKKETADSYRLYAAEKLPADRHLRNKVYLANLAALRQLAKEAPKADREARNVLLVADVEATWSRSFKECKTSLESLGRRVSTLALFAKLDPVDVELAINKEVVTILSQLESGSWLTNPGDEPPV